MLLSAQQLFRDFFFGIKYMLILQWIGTLDILKYS